MTVIASDCLLHVIKSAFTACQLPNFHSQETQDSINKAYGLSAKKITKQRLICSGHSEAVILSNKSSIYAEIASYD